MKNENKKIGIILEALPNMQFKVDLDGKIIRCYLGGKMKTRNITVGVGDKVELIYDPSLGGEIGRITWRL